MGHSSSDSMISDSLGKNHTNSNHKTAPHVLARPLKPTCSVKDGSQENVTLHPDDTVHIGIPEIKQGSLDNLKATVLGFILHPHKSVFQLHPASDPSHTNGSPHSYGGTDQATEAGV